MKRIALTVLTAGLLLGACADSTAPPAFAINATVDKATTTPGDSVSFVIRATGDNLVGLHVEFGDGTGLDRQLFGAQSMTATQRHAYSAVGEYTMTAAVIAASGEIRETMVGVQIR